MKDLVVAQEIADLFAPYKVWIVGGSVRDHLLGRDSDDLDLATDAVPTVSTQILREWGDEFWDPGLAYGTVCAIKDGQRIEITTLRKDTYDGETRLPEVEFGTSITDDLSRRDFKVNAMAVLVPAGGGDLTFIAPDGATDDLERGMLSTPRDPMVSLHEDPLRIVRAARFVSQLNFSMEYPLFDAMQQSRHKLERVAEERIIVELNKMLTSGNPFIGTSLLEATRVAEVIVPEAEAWQGQDDLPDDLAIQWAGWLIHATPQAAETRMRALKHPTALIRDVVNILKCLDEFIRITNGEGWSAASVRRFVNESGEYFDPTMELVAELMSTDELLWFWIAYQPLDGTDDLAHLKPILTGDDVMRLLHIPQGPGVGRALKELQETRYRVGPMTYDEEVEALRKYMGMWGT